MPSVLLSGTSGLITAAEAVGEQRLRCRVDEVSDVNAAVFGATAVLERECRLSLLLAAAAAAEHRVGITKSAAVSSSSGATAQILSLSAHPRDYTMHPLPSRPHIALIASTRPPRSHRPYSKE